PRHGAGTGVGHSVLPPLERPRRAAPVSHPACPLARYDQLIYSLGETVRAFHVWPPSTVCTSFPLLRAGPCSTITPRVRVVKPRSTNDAPSAAEYTFRQCCPPSNVARSTLSVAAPPTTAMPG